MPAALGTRTDAAAWAGSAISQALLAASGHLLSGPFLLRFNKAEPQRRPVTARPSSATVGTLLGLT